MPQPSGSSRGTTWLQINLHNAKAAPDVPSREFIRGQAKVALIQEPWTMGKLIRGLPKKSCKLIYSDKYEKPGAAILLDNLINFLPIPDFTSRDLVAVEVEVPTEQKGVSKR